MADLQAARRRPARAAASRLCVDLVLNHTAREHQWARQALAGDPVYRDFYLVFPDRTCPTRTKRTLPEVFPDMAPGSFTEVDGTRLGVDDVPRVPVGPELREPDRVSGDARHDVRPGEPRHRRAAARRRSVPLEADGHRLPKPARSPPAGAGVPRATGLAAPGLALKAEAIVSPDMLVQYLGAHDRYQPECDLAYDNQLMVMLWSTLASRDVRLAEQALSRRRPAPQSTSWVTYVRCHDDIGWAVSDADAAGGRARWL